MTTTTLDTDSNDLLSRNSVKFTLSIPKGVARYWQRYKCENPRGLSQAIARESFHFFQEIYGKDMPSDLEGDDSEMKKSFSRQVLETVLPAMYKDMTEDGFQYFDFSYFSRLMSRPPLCMLEVYVIRRFWNNLIELGYFVPNTDNPKIVTLSKDVIDAKGKLEGL